MSPDAGFWRGRRVLVTGHTGFQGAWLTLWLRRLGARLTGLALPPATDPSLFAAAIGPGAIVSRIGDIRDPVAVGRAVADARPEVVFHLAAQALVGPSYADPAATYATNLLGTVHVLEALRAVDGLQAAVLVTTDKCYETVGQPGPLAETARLGGGEPYGSSKACAELAIDCYRRAFFGGGRLASARAGNVIGGGDWAPGRLVPDLVRAARSGAPLTLRKPGAIRPWQHVLESLSGYIRLAECLARGPDEDWAEAWNFGPAESDRVTVGEIADRFAADAGGLARQVADAPPYPETDTLLIDSGKALGRLAWRRRLDIDAALSWTFEWYRREAAGTDAGALTTEQIERYEAL